MRYLSLAVFVAVAGSAAAFACGGDSASISAGHAGSSGEAGAVSEGGTAGTSTGGTSTGGAGASGHAGTAGSAGHAGTGGGAGGAAGEASAGEAGQGTAEAGAGGAAGEGQAPDSLLVTVGGVPTGKVANVTVTGPGGFTKNISATTTFDSLAAGSYTVTAPAIPVSGTQVDSIFDPSITGSPANVQLDTASTADVTYKQRPGTGMLWVTNFATHNAFGFNAATLAATGTQDSVASVSLNLTGVGTSAPPTPALAFSSTNDLWVGSCRNGQKPQVLAKFSTAKLGANSSPSPDVTVTLPSTDASYDCVGGLAFDSAGNLWVGMYHGHILRINASDLATTGTPTPAVVLSSTSFAAILDIAFDGAGNLFVAPFGKAVIPRVSASQLTASNAALVPDVLLTLPAGAGPGGLALGSDGGLWIADYNHSTLIKLDSASLSASGTPTPALSITGVAGPEQMAFDKVGNLWVAAYDSSTVDELAAADLTTGGAKVPVTSLTGGGLLGTFGLRFNP